MRHLSVIHILIYSSLQLQLWTELNLRGSRARERGGGQGGGLVVGLPQLEIRTPGQGAGQGHAAGQVGMARGTPVGSLACSCRWRSSF